MAIQSPIDAPNSINAGSTGEGGSLNAGGPVETPCDYAGRSTESIKDVNEEGMPSASGAKIDSPADVA